MSVDAVVIGGGVYSSYRRGVVLIPGEYWVIYDVLPPFDEDNQFDLGFQLAPGCKVTEMAHAPSQSGMRTALDNAM